MDTTELKHLKAQCIFDLRTYLRRPTVRAELEGIDPRLWQYVTDSTSPLEHYVLPLDDEGAEVEDCIASLHELLCIRKNLRKWRTYTLDTDYALRWLRAIEGVWRPSPQPSPVKQGEGVDTTDSPQPAEGNHSPSLNNGRVTGGWVHVSGGVKFDTPQGARHVRLMPFQVWFVVTTMLFQTEVDMEREYHEGDKLLPSEFVLEVEDDPLPL